MRYEITPVPKPRQTQSDKWKKRPCVLKYRSFADEVRRLKINIKPGDAITFFIPMPKSWSAKKKKEMNLTPHETTPDIDNFLKAILDACHKDDSHIHWLGELFKLWAYSGSIIVNRNIYRDNDYP